MTTRPGDDAPPPLPPARPGTIEFAIVSREFRNLVDRRRELLTLVGSIFAGLGVLLSNALDGKLPDDLGSIRRHIFASYALILMVPCLILALRMARLHGGLVLNGMLFARLVEGQDFAKGWTVAGARRHNFLGASFLQLVLVSLLAGFSTAILALAVAAPPAAALGCGVATLAASLAIYFHFHHRAVAFAAAKIARDEPGPIDREDWVGHISGSLKDANDHLNGDVAFVGLMVFSVFETLSGLGKIAPGTTDLASADIQRFGPSAYIALMVVTCLMGLISYARVRLALGKFSLLLDPTDRPFRPLALTDSLLGYAILAFLFAVSIHLAQGLILGSNPANDRMMLAVDAGAFALAILAQQLALVIAGRRLRPLASPPR
ncbi:hypothetical protein TA3x_000347 [Tundrisphaera sp. TA3]|uniref:hypothetical protein n=1 Tax=Tundrisphaera sp. TA3 TaxID=3435775 RepID=UPI003EBBA6CA